MRSGSSADGLMGKADAAPRSRQAPIRWLDRAGGPLMVMTSAVMIFVLVVLGRAMFRMPLGPIDDHDIPALLGADGVLPWGEVPATIVGAATEVARFRPGYWLVRVPEVALWGTGATGWYLDRFLLLIATLVGTFVLVRRFASSWIAVLAGLLVVAGPQAESWYRLGPQESIATPLLLWGLALIAFRHPVGAVLLIASALTKEAYIPFAMAGAAFAWLVGARRTASITAFALCAVAVAVVVVEFRADLYVQSRSLADVVGTLVWMLWTTALTTLWPIVLGLALIAGWRPSRWPVLIAAALVVAEAYLYAGLHQYRYLLPVVLVAVATVVVGLRAFPKRWLVPMTAAILVAVTVATIGAASDARQWDRRNHRWQTGLAQIRALMAENPTAPIVLHIRSVGDYELVYSLRRYLPTGVAMLAPLVADPKNALETRLYERLSQISLGDAEVGYVPFHPSDPCIGVVLGKLRPTGCAAEVAIRVP